MNSSLFLPRKPDAFSLENFSDSVNVLLDKYASGSIEEVLLAIRLDEDLHPYWSKLFFSAPQYKQVNQFVFGLGALSDDPVAVKKEFSPLLELAGFEQVYGDLVLKHIAYEGGLKAMGADVRPALRVVWDGSYSDLLYRDIDSKKFSGPFASLMTRIRKKLNVSNLDFVLSNNLFEELIYGSADLSVPMGICLENSSILYSSPICVAKGDKFNDYFIAFASHEPIFAQLVNDVVLRSSDLFDSIVDPETSYPTTPMISLEPFPE